LSWDGKEFVHDFVITIVLLAMENIFGLDKKHFDCQQLYYYRGAIPMPLHKKIIVFHCQAFLIRLIFTTFDIRTL
jgi:hypothetical protein